MTASSSRQNARKISTRNNAKTKVARDYILDEIMLKQIAEPRKEISKYAPSIINTTIKVKI